MYSDDAITMILLQLSCSSSSSSLQEPQDKELITNDNNCRKKKSVRFESFATVNYLVPPSVEKVPPSVEKDPPSLEKEEDKNEDTVTGTTSLRQQHQQQQQQQQQQQHLPQQHDVLGEKIIQTQREEEEQDELYNSNSSSQQHQDNNSNWYTANELRSFKADVWITTHWMILKEESMTKHTIHGRNNKNDSTTTNITTNDKLVLEELMKTTNTFFNLDEYIFESRGIEYRTPRGRLLRNKRRSDSLQAVFFYQKVQREEIQEHHEQLFCFHSPTSKAPLSTSSSKGTELDPTDSNLHPSVFFFPSLSLSSSSDSRYHNSKTNRNDSNINSKEQQEQHHSRQERLNQRSQKVEIHSQDKLTLFLAKVYSSYCKDSRSHASYIGRKYAQEERVADWKCCEKDNTISVHGTAAAAALIIASPPAQTIVAAVNNDNSKIKATTIKTKTNKPTTQQTHPSTGTERTETITSFLLNVPNTRSFHDEDNDEDEKKKEEDTSDCSDTSEVSSSSFSATISATSNYCTRDISTTTMKHNQYSSSSSKIMSLSLSSPASSLSRDCYEDDTDVDEITIAGTNIKGKEREKETSSQVAGIEMELIDIDHNNLTIDDVDVDDVDVDIDTEIQPLMPCTAINHSIIDDDDDDDDDDDSIIQGLDKIHQDRYFSFHQPPPPTSSMPFLSSFMCATSCLPSSSTVPSSPA